jgi:hypothetical protein
MDAINSFQKCCESDLSNRLNKFGVIINNKKIEYGIFFEDEEWFIEGNVLDFKIWIYEDGASISGNKIDFCYESVDYESLDDLKGKFVSQVISLVEEKI